VAAGQRQPASPDTTDVNNQNQATIGQSPRSRTGVPISAGRFNSKDATQVNNHALVAMAQSLLQSGVMHLTGTHHTVNHAPFDRKEGSHLQSARLIVSARSH